MTQQPKQQGGARVGAGRKPRTGPPPIPVSIKLTPEVYATWTKAKRKYGMSGPQLVTYLLAK